MPEQSNDIAGYRKRRRLKRLKRKLTIFAVIATLAFLVVLTAPLWRGLGDELALRVSLWSKGDVSTGFPLRVSASQSPRMLALGDRPLVLTDTHLYFFDKNGTELRVVQHGYPNPVMRLGGRKLLVYDRGGYSLSVESPLSRSLQKTVESPIVLARISSGDTIAAVTRTKRYSMLLTVYGDKGAPLFEWEGYQIQDVAFLDGGSGCVAATLGADGGEMKTTLQSFRFGSADVQWKQVLQGTMLLSLRERSKGGFYAVGDDRTVLFDNDGSTLGSYTYPGNLVAVADDGDKLALLFEDEASGKQSLALLAPPVDQNAGLALARSLDEEISSVLLQDGKVTLIAEDALVQLDGALRGTRRIPLEGAETKAWLLRGTYYVLGADGIDRLVENPADS